MKKYIRISVGALILSLSCIAFFFGATVQSNENDFQQMKKLNTGWYYMDDSGNKKSVELPSEINAGNKLSLFYDGEEKIDAGEVIATFGAMYNVEIYVGFEQVYRFHDDGREINGAVRGNIVCSAIIPSEVQSKDIHLVYYSDSGKYHLSTITLSTEKILMKSVFLKSLVCLVISIAMLVIGVLALIFGFVLKFQKKFDGRIFCIGVFLLFCGLWCISDSAFIDMLTEYSELIFACDFYLFMIMPIPLAYFVLCSERMKENKIIRAIPFLYYLNIIIQSIFVVCGVFTFFRMLYFTHFLMMMAGVICPLTILIRNFQRKKEAEILLCIQLLSAVGIHGAIAIILYIFLGYSTYQIIYQTGLLILMSILLSVLLKEFAQSVRNRTEAVIYKQLSEQDKLTTLNNRRSFDSLLEKMENGVIQFENAALLFMDVNFLKKANDTYGHEYGDVLLIGAAECIKNAYGTYGYCYRIGGDEFCAILFDTPYSDEELLHRIEEEIKAFNEKTRSEMELSIAVGCSFILAEGKRKSVNEWKQEADNMMYAEKKRIKAQR